MSAEDQTARSDEQYTAKDVREMADLSYHQLNDWDGKGLLPGAIHAEGKWRRFTPRDLFTIMVCSKLRDKFGASLESIRFVRDFMLQEDADHFRAAAEMMGELGVPVLLITDLKEMFVMDSVLEWIDVMKHGYFSGEADGSDGGAYAVVVVNPIVNRILGCLKEPISIPYHGQGYKILRLVNETLAVRNEAELKILDLARSRDFQRIEVVLKGGQVQLIRAEQDLVDLTVEGIQAVVEERKYETITLKKRDGEVVRAVREIAFKPNSEDLYATKQKDPARRKKRNSSQ